ncbi:MAG: serine hydrolase domain-containing protein, partial [Terriglobia bacterium]
MKITRSLTRAIRVAMLVLVLNSSAIAIRPGLSAPSSGGGVSEPTSSRAAGQLAGIEPVVEEALDYEHIPGAVVVIGHNGRIVYDRAFGYRTRIPRPSRMRRGTLFDLASLTKVIATTPAVMQLFEQGKIRLNDPVAKYWPEFGQNGKQAITVRELLTHYSGLPPDLPLEAPWSGYEAAMNLIVQARPVAPPGTRFIYSDINFEALGELVRRIAGEPLDVYCGRHIFMPLGMIHTRFNPPARLHAHMAPTQPPNQKNER